MRWELWGNQRYRCVVSCVPLPAGEVSHLSEAADLFWKGGEAAGEANEVTGLVPEGSTSRRAGRGTKTNLAAL